MPLTRRQLMLASALPALPGLCLGQAQAQTEQPARGASAKRAAPSLPVVGRPYALVSTPLLGGGNFEPAQAEGKALVLYWWASWCPYCSEQNPDMQKLWAAQRGNGLQMLALSIDRKPDAASAYLKAKGYTFPSAWVSPELARAYAKPDGVPFTMVRGKNGRVVQIEDGQLFPEEVAELKRWV